MNTCKGTVLVRLCLAVPPLVYSNGMSVTPDQTKTQRRPVEASPGLLSHHCSAV